MVIGALDTGAAAPGVAASGASGTAPAEGTAAIDGASPLAGTADDTGASTAAGAGAAGPLFHSRNSRKATASQAISRKERVWFMGRRRAPAGRPGPRGGSRSGFGGGAFARARGGRHCAGRGRGLQRPGAFEQLQELSLQF